MIFRGSRWIINRVIPVDGCQRVYAVEQKVVYVEALLCDQTWPFWEVDGSSVGCLTFLLILSRRASPAIRRAVQKLLPSVEELFVSSVRVFTIFYDLLLTEICCIFTMHRFLWYLWCGDNGKVGIVEWGSPHRILSSIDALHASHDVAKYSIPLSSKSLMRLIAGWCVLVS